MGGNIISIIFGSQYHDSILIFKILLFYFILTFNNSVFTFTLIGIEKVRLYTKSLIIGAMAFVAIIFCPFSLSATIMAPIALAVQQAISMLMMMHYFRKSKFTNLFFRVFLPLLVAIIFATFVIYCQPLYPILVFITTAVLSLPSIAVASGINRNDLSVLKGLLK